MSTTLHADPIASRNTSRVRAAIVSAILALGALAVAVVVLWQPWGERDKLGYDDIAPHADAAWLGALVDGLGFAAVGIALGLAVCLLAPARASAWANISAVLTGIGGVAFCAGMISFGTIAWYATNTDAIPADTGRSLMTYVENNPGHALGTQMAGFLLVTLGSLVSMAALWRARSVPRWLPIAYLCLTIGVFVLDGIALNVIQAAQMLSLVVVAYYAWRAGGRSEQVTP